MNRTTQGLSLLTALAGITFFASPAVAQAKHETQAQLQAEAKISAATARATALAKVPHGVVHENAAAEKAEAKEARRDTATIADRQLFHRSDLYVASAFVVGTIALLPLDKHFEALIRDEDLTANQRIRRLSSAAKFMGGPAALIIGSTMYVVGRFGQLLADHDVCLRASGRALRSTDWNCDQTDLKRTILTDLTAFFPGLHGMSGIRAA